MVLVFKKTRIFALYFYFIFGIYDKIISHACILIIATLPLCLFMLSMAMMTAA
jgi:hypothetical protein